jgi:hypothetical protein
MKPHSVTILFDSELFDVEAEPPNDINPIRGHSFLAWLSPRLEAAGHRVDGPDTEDWGWYLEAAGPSGRYVVGASAIPSRGKVVDWTLQITRARSIGERLRGEGRIGPADPLVRWIEACVREQVGASETVVEILDSRGRIVEEDRSRL